MQSLRHAGQRQEEARQSLATALYVDDTIERLLKRNDKGLAVVVSFHHPKLINAMFYELNYTILFLLVLPHILNVKFYGL
jgi:hypothetical protein